MFYIGFHYLDLINYHHPLNDKKMSLDISLKDPTSTYESGYLYDTNITHNLNAMADAAGIYEALWRPHRLKEGYNIPENDHKAEYKFEEENPSIARDIIGRLGIGLDLLKKDPEYFKTFNSPNGWGMYEHFVSFVEKYLNACIEYPDAIIEVSR
jgi:hypothetical protein